MVSRAHRVPRHSEFERFAGPGGRGSLKATKGSSCLKTSSPPTLLALGRLAAALVAVIVSGCAAINPKPASGPSHAATDIESRTSNAAPNAKPQSTETAEQPITPAVPVQPPPVRPAAIQPPSAQPPPTQPAAIQSPIRKTTPAKSSAGSKAAVQAMATTGSKPSVAPAVSPASRGAEAPPANPAVKPLPAAKPAAPALDLAALEQRLRDTHAIGVFTKLSLKNQVDDLLNQFRAYYRKSTATPPDDLRHSYDLLMLKVLSSLQDGDPPLAAAIAGSREAVWGILADPEKFAKL